MTEPCFESSLSMEEIEYNFKDINFFDGIMAGLEEALAYEKGKASADTFVRKQSLPLVDVAAISNRKKIVVSH